MVKSSTHSYRAARNEEKDEGEGRGTERNQEDEEEKKAEERKENREEGEEERKVAARIGFVERSRGVSFVVWDGQTNSHQRASQKTGR